METGNMDRVVLFQQRIGTRLPNGQIVQGWEDIPTIPKQWASMRTDRGKEEYQAEKKTVLQHIILKVHYRPDLDSAMSVVFENRRWDITSIQELQRRRGLLVHCTWTDGQYNYPDDVIPEPEEEE